ncbi:hypothetical protein HYC85_026534 [Camellia sinensis]|uniref:FH2 domain-containing protein n=1 Tax=Camellia sinensis TaxID=4442 RepID=A0A7J7G532_CAMSI|nr:hypothetical protein HYC85_026534 [Camellia sinensis]
MNISVFPGVDECPTSGVQIASVCIQSNIFQLGKGSAKLCQIMQMILTLGNALNQGTARGSVIGFKLDSLLKLFDTRARNNKMTLMHYLCKLIAELMPELLDFDKDLVHLEVASMIQLKSLAEEMLAVSKGLEKVEQELTDLDNDGTISASVALKNFLDTAEAKVRSIISLYSEVLSLLTNLSRREEVQIHCLSILAKVQLGPLLNKVWLQRIGCILSSCWLQ